MSQNFRCSLIITTYNWHDALKKCLQSVLWQTVMPDEVIIADDGSKQETVNLVQSMIDTFPVPLIFLTQEKIGRRKTRIDNIAIAKAKFPYLIFIDHDIMLHPDFVKDHISLAEEGYFLNGSRFLLDDDATQKYIAITAPKPSDLRKLTGKNSMNKLRIPFLMRFLAKRYRTGPDRIIEVRGCNMSFWRKDIVAVNGYDEAYMEWGREDSNIAIRLNNIGIKKKSIKFGAVTYHLNHKPSNKDDDPMNMQLLMDSIARKEKWAKNGLDQYLDKQ